MIDHPSWFRGITLGLVFSVLLSGCSYRRPIPVSPQQPGPPEGLTERDLGRRVVVILADGTRLEGRLDAIDTRGIGLQGQTADTMRDIPYEQIHRIDVLTRDYPGVFVGVLVSAAAVLVVLSFFMWDLGSLGN